MTVLTPNMIFFNDINIVFNKYTGPILMKTGFGYHQTTINNTLVLLYKRNFLIVFYCTVNPKPTVMSALAAWER